MVYTRAHSLDDGRRRSDSGGDHIANFPINRANRKSMTALTPATSILEMPMDLSDFATTVLSKATQVAGHGGYAAQSCARHLERAWSLQDSMPELAVFSAITAEEESAAAIFHSLKKKKYVNAETLSIRKHLHKAGVSPFIKLVGDSLIPKDSGLTPTLYFDEDDESGGILRVRLPIGIDGERQICIVIEPPLGVFSSGQDGKEKDYHTEVSKIASQKGIKSIFDYVKKIANERNEMLYASQTGIPNASHAADRVSRHTEAAVYNLMIFLLIEPHRTQSLVQDALNAYIKILNRIDASKKV